MKEKTVNNKKAITIDEDILNAINNLIFGIEMLAETKAVVCNFDEDRWEEFVPQCVLFPLLDLKDILKMKGISDE